MNSGDQINFDELEDEHNDLSNSSELSRKILNAPPELISNAKNSIGRVSNEQDFKGSMNEGSSLSKSVREITIQNSHRLMRNSSIDQENKLPPLIKSVKKEEDRKLKDT
jgi:hypothetical protein